MSEIKKNKKKITVRQHVNSGLSKFIERPVPSEKEVDSFERVVHKQARNKEIENNLSEIYRDKAGKMINVKKMNVKRRPMFLVRLFRRLLIFCIILAVAYFAYLYFFSQGNDSSALELNIIAPEEVIAGEEFSYSIDYSNPSKFSLEQLRLEIQYPDNFVFIGSSITPESGNYGWNLPDLKPYERASLTITGKIISAPDSINIISTRLNYVPVNFSSNFKKEASSSTIVSGVGFRVTLDVNNTAFVGQENEMTLSISDVENNYLGDFNLSFMPAEHVEVWLATSTEDVAGDKQEKEKIQITKNRGLNWQITDVNKEVNRYRIPVVFKANEEATRAEIVVRLEKKMEDGQAYTFWETTINPELIKSDLNLTLFLNGSKDNNASSFGQTLEYELNYSNQGENAFKDVAIMAILDSEFLDWTSFNSKPQGDARAGSIVWTKEEIPALAEIEPGQSGRISFSLNLNNWQEEDLGQDLNISSYAQYSFGNKSIKGEENKSNTIITQINSDLNLEEAIRYFDNDNIPVGSGPLPPKVGQKTGFKVYWTIKNNLHELSDLKVTLDLPSYVAWDGKSSTNVGNLNYNNSTHQVTWDIGRLPTSVYQVEADFGISITPGESDLNKILVLSSGSVISATDTETQDSINKKTKPRTTKLEDDDIANLNNSGIVE